MLSLPTLEFLNLQNDGGAKDSFPILPFEVTMEENTDLGKHCVAYDKNTLYSCKGIC